MADNCCEKIKECIKELSKMKCSCMPNCVIFAMVIAVIVCCCVFFFCCKPCKCDKNRNNSMNLLDLTLDTNLHCKMNYSLSYNITDSKISIDNVKIWHDETHDYSMIKSCYICYTIILAIIIICITIVICFHCKYCHELQKNCINKINDACIAEMLKK